MPMLVITIVVSVWVAAWSQQLTAEVERHSWSALHQDEKQKVAAASFRDSFQKVLLKDDQVVGMR